MTLYNQGDEMIHENKTFSLETFTYDPNDSELVFTNCILRGCMFDDRLTVIFKNCQVLEKCEIVPQKDLRWYNHPNPIAPSAWELEMERAQIAGMCGHTTPDWEF